MTDIFISYVREDSQAVDGLAQTLKANGLTVWIDRDELAPGARWKEGIRRAIETGTYFLSVHSRNREARDKSYVNEELTLAIDELRKRPSNKAWFIPIKLDECEIENRSIGAGETLLDLQFCDLTDWANGTEKLLKTLGVRDPKTSASPFDMSRNSSLKYINQNIFQFPVFSPNFAIPLLSITAFFTLIALGYTLWSRGVFSDTQSNALLFYFFAWIMTIFVFVGLWSQSRTARIQMTLSALQTLRTDGEYLSAAAKVRAKLHGEPFPVSEDILNELRFPAPPRDTFENPDFVTSTFFVMNQYEFLAAGARQGVLESDLLKETIESAVCGLLDSIAPFVGEIREHRPKTWRNLVWLYWKFRGKHNDALGPLV